MENVIKLDYPAMEEMAKQCLSVASRLEQTGQLAKQIAQQLQNGAMLGAAGEEFANAQVRLAPQVHQISEKFKEISKDIQSAIADMQAQDRQAGGRFK